MKAAFFRYPGQVQLREVQVPQPKGPQVLVRVLACGICGSDRTNFHRGRSDWQRAGHEYAGVVEQVGPHVSKVRPGDRITGVGSIPCGECPNCRAGRGRYCFAPLSFGGGAYAEFVCHDEVFCEDATALPPEVASLAEPLTVAIELVQDGRVEAGSVVLLVGAGPIGLMALRLCLLAGANKIYVAHTSTDSARAKLAREWGASALITASGERLVEAVREQEAHGVDTALLTVPPSLALAACIECTRPGGVIAFVGVEWERRTRLALPLDKFHFGKQTLVGSNHNPCQRMYPTALELLRSRKIDGQRLISHRFALAEVAAAFEFVASHKDEVVKVVITPFEKE